MKTTVAPLRFTLKRPIRGTTERLGFLFRVQDEQGRWGSGEATPWPTIDALAMERLEALLRRVEVARLPTSLGELGAWLDSLALSEAARAAVECALLDLMGQSRGVPLAVLLGAQRGSVRVNALIEGTDAKSLADEARTAVGRGFDTLKIKVGAHPLAVDAQRLLSVRLAVGASVKLRIDANGAWTEGEARSALRGLASLHLELCEQPLPASDVGGLRRLKGRVGCLVAADESVAHPTARDDVLSKERGPAVDIVVLKPAELGGLLPALEWAQRAHAVGVASYVTTSLDGPWARAACAHLAAALPGDTYAHGLSTVELLAGLEPDAFTPQSGSTNVPSNPGLGLP